MAKQPTIIDVTPSNYATDVNISTSIRATFDIDLDSRYINDFVYLQDNSSNRIEGRISYKKKVITFTPLEPLQKGLTYQFFLIGDSNLTDVNNTGLRSILGDCMEGSQVTNFTTEASDLLPAPNALSPTHNSIVRSKPTFEWISVDKAVGYEVEISKTNTFNTKLFPLDDDTTIQGTSLEPNMEFEDGLYYWRIRTIADTGLRGLWSKTIHFNLTTDSTGKVSEGDSEYVDPTDDLIFNQTFELEFIEAFPKENEMHVKTNVKNLFFRLLGDIDMSLIDIDSMTLEGQHISEDFEEETHGKVKGRVTFVESPDGTIYLVFNPEPLVPVTEVGGV